MNNNEVIIVGKVVEELNKYIKDGVHYGSLLIEAKSKYEMNTPIIKCIFAGPTLEKIDNNISKGDILNIEAHLIMEDNNIEVIVDEVNPQ